MAKCLFHCSDMTILVWINKTAATQCFIPFVIWYENNMEYLGRCFLQTILNQLLIFFIEIIHFILVYLEPSSLWHTQVLKN